MRILEVLRGISFAVRSSVPRHPPAVLTRRLMAARARGFAKVSVPSVWEQWIIMNLAVHRISTVLIPVRRRGILKSVSVVALLMHQKILYHYLNLTESRCYGHTGAAGSRYPVHVSTRCLCSSCWLGL